MIVDDSSKSHFHLNMNYHLLSFTLNMWKIFMIVDGSYCGAIAFYSELLPEVLGNRSIYFQGTGDIVKLFSWNKGTPD